VVEAIDSVCAVNSLTMQMPIAVHGLCQVEVNKWIDAADYGREKAKMEARLRFHSSFAINNFHKINSE
jgi:hypothetical protein